MTYLHRYARTFNLVVSDSTSIAVDAANLFQRLEPLCLLSEVPTSP